MGDYIPHDMSHMYVDQLERDWNQLAPDVSEAGDMYVRRELEAAISFLALCERGVRSLEFKPHDDGHTRLYDFEPLSVRAEDFSWYEVRLALKYRVSESKGGIQGMIPLMRIVDQAGGYLVGAQSRYGLTMVEGVIDTMREPAIAHTEPVAEFMGFLRAETGETAARLERAHRMQTHYIDLLGNLATSSDFVNSVVQSWTDFTKFNRQNLQ